MIKKLTVILAVLLLSSGCIDKLIGKKDSSPATADSPSTGTGGGSGGSGGSGGITVSTSSTVFQFTLQSLTGAVGVAYTTPALPSAVTPTISTTGMLTSLTTPTDVSNTASVAAAATSVSVTPVTSVNATTVTRSQNVVVSRAVSSCSSLMNLSCAVNGGDATILNLTSIDMSTFTNATTAFSLTVDGQSLNVPITSNTITKTQSYQHNTVQGQPVEVVEIGNYFYYTTTYSISGTISTPLYRLDKTTSETRLVFGPGGTGGGGKISSLTVFNGELYFNTKVGNGTTYFLKYNPTGDSITMLSDSTTLTGTKGMVVFNNVLYFSSKDASGYYRLFRMNTSGSIKQMTNLCTGVSDGPVKILSAGGALYMRLNDPNDCTKLIITRMNANETFTPLLPLDPAGAGGLSDDVDVNQTVVFDGKTYFTAGLGTNSYMLYKDNADGTVTLSTPYNGFDETKPVHDPMVSNGKLYYRNSTGNSGRIWKMDTTGALHYMPKASFTPSIREMILVDGNVYFTALNSGNYTKLYKIKSDDTVQQIMNLRGASVNDNPESLRSYNNELYFIATNSAGYKKVFKFRSDSTLYQVSDVNGPSSADFYTTASDAMISSASGLILSSTAYDFSYVIK